MNCDGRDVLDCASGRAPASEKIPQNDVAAWRITSLSGARPDTGAPKPDITTVDAFKQTLLSARSIVYADPAKGGASGVYFARVLDRLGIAEQMKAKTILVPGAQAAEVVAKGEAELGVAQGSEIVPVAGAQLVGPLPGEYASMTVFTAGIGAAQRPPMISLSRSRNLISGLCRCPLSHA
jgi:hypothetical protein